MFSEMIPGDPGADKTSDGIFLIRMRKAAGRDVVGRAGRNAESRENLSSRGRHLGTQPIEDCEGGFFGAWPSSPTGPTHDGQPFSQGHAAISSRVL